MSKETEPKTGEATYNVLCGIAWLIVGMAVCGLLVVASCTLHHSCYSYNYRECAEACHGNNCRERCMDSSVPIVKDD